MRFLAIDYGNKRTGLAVCDNSETITSPLEVAVSDGSLFDRILSVIRREQAQAVVIGLPLNMDDTEGPQAKRTREFAAKLRQKIDIPIEFFDERLSSFAAEDRLVDLDLTRKGKKKRLDAVAAAAILEAFLETRRNKKASTTDHTESFDNT
ncbi:MAG: Holliday junction resolvase RuvX [Sedimentisphaerales bacterium]|nr:Holliday junction resolvase RuvX [Sedimentisphaerales bacterium]